MLSSVLQSHVLAVDYRGFGDSSGWPTEEGQCLGPVPVMYNSYGSRPNYLTMSSPRGL
jgi:pimeloyl-ACP methyl ester carboxylesterase